MSSLHSEWRHGHGAHALCCCVQVLSAAGAAWFIGGEESDVNRVLQARQQPDTNGSRPLQWAHFPRDTWQLDHWDVVPVGGHPSAAYMSALPCNHACLGRRPTLLRCSLLCYTLHIAVNSHQNTQSFPLLHVQ